jgi:hypothetical protein
MAAATIKSRKITVAPGVDGRTWEERVYIDSLGAGSPSTFTSDLAEIDGAVVAVNKAGAGVASVSWVGRAVSVSFTSPADDNSDATVILHGKR